MPVWLFKLISNSPALVGIVVVAYFAYMIIKHIMDSPLSIATIFGVMAGKERREDARKLVELLCEQGDGDQPVIEGPNQRPPRRWRRKRRRRRRRRS